MDVGNASLVWNEGWPVEGLLDSTPLNSLTLDQASLRSALAFALHLAPPIT
jgi:hypothetical protein